MSQIAADLSGPGVQNYRNVALKATAQLVKATAGLVYGWKVQNLDMSDAYLQIYDAAAAASVTVGTTVPAYTIWLPSSGGDDLAMTRPFKLNNGVVVAATTTIGGNTAPATGELVNLFWA